MALDWFSNRSDETVMQFSDSSKETLYSEAELAGEDTMDLCDPFWDDEEF